MTHREADEKELPLAAGEHPPFPGAVKIASEDLAARPLSAQAKARKTALDVLYQAELRGLDPQDVLAAELTETPARDRQLTRQVIAGVAAQRAELDARISAASSPDWPIERMPPIDRNLARIAVWEMDNSELPSSIIIAEATSLADALSTEKSVRFLNGLLSAAAQDRSKKDENAETH